MNNPEKKEIKLKYQHRMHPEISQFISENFYNGTQVLDPDGQNGTYDIREFRTIPYRANKKRNVWLEVNYGTEIKRSKTSPRNEEEAKRVLESFKQFEIWAKTHPKDQYTKEISKIWSIAVITFYRGQESYISDLFQKYLKSNRRKFFNLPDRNISIKICSVDRFQGQEADFVILSFVRTKSIGFLDCMNRLNVALSRAKYHQELVGNKKFFHQSWIKNKAPILYQLTSLPSDKSFKKQ